MKLLIITQKVDKNDSILGFFHRWLEEFAKNYEKLTVICLYRGSYDLPQNVRVLSLGKEDKPSKLKYVFRFYKYIWQYRHDYQAVFVHMNQEYILLAAWYWHLMGKKIYLWRNHVIGNFLTRWAVLFSHKVFYTSSSAFVAHFKNSVVMPVGNDELFFSPVSGIERQKDTVCMLGRIAPIKNIDLALRAMSILVLAGKKITLTIVGSARPQEIAYYDSLTKYVQENNLSDYVFFVPEQPMDKHPEIFSAYSINLNLTASGSFDKTILGGISCGALPLVTNQSLKGLLPAACVVDGDPQSVAQGIIHLLDTSASHQITEDLNHFVKFHSLSSLFNKLLIEIDSKRK